jgi:3D (Asp-Asp-Asp) domain-containing protein
MEEISTTFALCRVDLSQALGEGFSMKTKKMLKMGSFKIFAITIAALAALGCGTASNKLLDESSKEETKGGPEYIDFSDLQLSDVPDKDGDLTAAKIPPTIPNTSTPPNQPGVNPGQPSNPSQQATPGAPQMPPITGLKQSGYGIGTVYYLPVYGEKRNCPKNEISTVKDEQEKILTQLCKDEVYNCAMQGSCFYLGKEGVRLFAYKKMVKVEVPETKKIISQPRFRLNQSFTICPQGMGAHNVCLDPYRSVAADPKFHKIGDVLYMPILKDQKLPNGEIHDGYMIVRDTGGAIKGEGRFDFFIGFDDYHGHLFSQLNLSNKKENTFVYHLVPEDIAEKVRVSRRYPLAPLKVHETAIAEMKEALNIKQGLVSMKEVTAFYKLKFNSIGL